MKHASCLAIAALCAASSAVAIVAPQNGGALPPSYFRVKTAHAGAYHPTRAWVQRAARARDSRRVLAPGLSLSPPSPLTGTILIPVLTGEFADRRAIVSADTLQKVLFDGPTATGTIGEYFEEVSYGLLTVTGTVYDWVTVSQNDNYYEGGSNGLEPGDARTGEFLKEVLDANDPAIDFGAFDNDGPDGLPNSGDDDGFVDFVAFVHSEKGGECSPSSNIWSHSWEYRAWPVAGFPPQAYATNDPSANGGLIQINDYVILPSRSCEGSIATIGAFCHEIGHAFGLPDLFDANGGGSGIGHWGLMGSGHWNRPNRPAHPCAWSRVALGWVTPTEVTWQGETRAIPDIGGTPACFLLPFTDDRFRIVSECAINGAYSLRCCLDAAEAAARNWPGGPGYGNGWVESIERTFVFDGTTPVHFSYEYRYDLETGYDLAEAVLSVGGVETVLDTYTGAGTGHADHDLSAALSGIPAGTPYVLRFRVKADDTGSDEDGDYVSSCGALVVDDVAVMGGGEFYTNDFESSIDGWHQNPAQNPPTEYWLVENRQGVGFDEYLHREGLVVMHVDDNIIGSRMGNSRGDLGDGVPGLAVEEADGLGQLLQDPGAGGNAGDAGDVFPGTSNNTAFDASSLPNSADNTQRQTHIEISGISVLGATMTAFMRAGDPAPVATGIAPMTIENDQVSVPVEISGNGFRQGASFRLEKSGESAIIPAAPYWKDASTLQGDVNVYSKAGGTWDLVVANPDGQEVRLSDAVTLVQIVAATLVSVSLEAHVDGIELVFELRDHTPAEVLVVSRALAAAGPWHQIADRPVELQPGVYRLFDAQVEAGVRYHYRLTAHEEDGVRELYRGSAVVPARAVELEQNYPNPFNPTTRIRFFLPSNGDVRLDVFNVTGARVRTLASGYTSAGPHERTWDGRDEAGAPVATGVYLYRLRVGRTVLKRRMILLK